MGLASSPLYETLIMYWTMCCIGATLHMFQPLVLW